MHCTCLCLGQINRTGKKCTVFHPAQSNLQSWESIMHPFSFLPVHIMTVLQAKPYHSWGASVNEATTGVFGKKLDLVLQWEGHITCNLGQHSPRSGVYKYLLASQHWPLADPAPAFWRFCLGSRQHTSEQFLETPPLPSMLLPSSSFLPSLQECNIDPKHTQAPLLQSPQACNPRHPNCLLASLLSFCSKSSFLYVWHLSLRWLADKSALRPYHLLIRMCVCMSVRKWYIHSNQPLV